jgi:hypothetical protein
LPAFLDWRHPIHFGRRDVRRAVKCLRDAGNGTAHHSSFSRVFVFSDPRKHRAHARADSSHFNAAGDANAWGSPNILWLLLLIQVLTCGGLLLVPLLTRRFPWMVHLGRRRLNDFTAAQQQRILPLLFAMLEYLTVPLALLFTVLIRQMIEAASSPHPHLTVWWALAASVSATVAILVLYMRRIDAAADGALFGRPSAG